MKEQHELYENARKRIQQKKGLYAHFVVFLVGSIFFIVLNKLLKLGENYIENWFIWVITIWFFIWILHFINVFFTNRFLGKDWERSQTEKLITKQQQRIAKLEKEILNKKKLKVESEQYTTELKKKENPQNNTTD
jgi:cell shape-determining protein MreC